MLAPRGHIRRLQADPAKEAAIHLLDTVVHQIASGPTLPYAILVLVLVLAPLIAEKLRLPGMVGLVLAGMALGPHGSGLLATKEIALSSMGEFGLLYLMFSAGLELDLKLFLKMRKAALTFAIASFVIPFTLGTFSARMLHYDWAAAVLMGSNWGSHTLVTYPLLRQMGLARNRGVSTVVGATAVTDTSALLVLAVVSGTVKATGSLGVQLGMLAVDLALLVTWSLLALPHVARWFFARVGTDRSYRFLFGISVFLVGGVLAEAGGIDAIVGAFFAGLGLNRAVPEQSPLMERLQFPGATLFIPIFLVSVGVLLEPRVMIDPKTLGIALVFTLAVLGGKALAAVVAGRAFRFTWPEVGVMSGLSGSQAAATLATTLVGAKLGLFDKQTINAVLVVILVSLVITPAMVTLFGKRVSAAAEEMAPLGKLVLVPVWGDSARTALTLAGRLATSDGGIVLAASFADRESSEAERAAGRQSTSQAEAWLAKGGLEARTLFRVAESVPEGLLETALGENATLLVTEWRTGLRDVQRTRAALARSPVPVLIANGDLSQRGRLVVVARPGEAELRDRDLALAARLLPSVGHGHRVAVVTRATAAVRSLFTAQQDVEWIDAPDPIAWISGSRQADDLLLLVGIDLAQEALGAIPSLERERFLAVQAAIERPSQRTEPVTGPVVSGRGLKPRHA